MKIETFFHNYCDDLHDALITVDKQELIRFNDAITFRTLHHLPILVFGNGGSAAIAEHLATDWNKGIAHDCLASPSVICLNSNHALLTALANDYGYEHVFSKQIEYFKEHALVLAISSSGNSPNIVNGLKIALAKGCPVAALVGFDGGKVVKDNLAPGLTVHVKSYNYGLVEDAHSIIMHAVCQHIRLSLSSAPDSVKL